MLVVPYFVDTTDANWIKLGIFLCEGGRSIWSTDNTDTDAQIKKMLKDNGFPVQSLRRAGGTVYANIDHTRIILKNFYMWTEVDPKTSENDVWRFFQIPVGLWSCPVFKEHFWKSTTLPISILSIEV